MEPNSNKGQVIIESIFFIIFILSIVYFVQQFAVHSKENLKQYYKNTNYSWVKKYESFNKNKTLSK